MLCLPFTGVYVFVGFLLPSLSAPVLVVVLLRGAKTVEVKQNSVDSKPDAYYAAAAGGKI